MSEPFEAQGRLKLRPPKNRSMVWYTGSVHAAYAPASTGNPALPSGTPGSVGGIRLRLSVASIRGRRGPPGTGKNSSTRCLEIVNA
jgi:hypothetical protein